MSQGGIPYNANYVRNSVKVVVNAYTGKMTFYVADPKDPIIKAYEATFPKMFQPMSKMPVTIQAHLRYPSDIFSVQAAILGRYHIKSAVRLLHRVGPLGGLAHHRRWRSEPGARGEADDRRGGQRRPRRHSRP